jgi:solute:Na+ symporter, SSS family
MQDFGGLNWAILAVYVLIVLTLGFRLSRGVSTAEDFYVGRRTTPWWAIGISVVATYVSALSFLGGPAWSYSNSLSVIAIHLNYPIVLFVVVTVFLPFFYNSGVASIYDYMEKRFGPTSRVVVSVVFLLSQALTSAAVLYATALVVQFVTGVDVKMAIVIMSGIALLYTFMGGTVAVIWTDVFQASVLFIGAFVIVFSLLHRLPMPLPDFLHQLSLAGKTRALNFSTDPTVEATVWSGVIAMSLYHVTIYGANQMMVQRTLAAKNIGDAKKSYLLMGFVAFFIYFLFFLLGILFYGYYGGREFANGNTIILEFASEQHIPGLMGVIVASIIAASMSSLGAAINSLSTVSTVDFYQRYLRRDATPEHCLKVSRLFTVFWALAIIVPAILYSTSKGSVLQTLSMVGAYFVGANLAMYGLGFFSKHTTERGLLIGVVVGFLSVWLTAAHTQIAWPWYCLIGGGVNILVAVVASRVLDGRQAEWSEYSVPGQKQRYLRQGLPLKDGGWYVVPGKVDRVCYALLGFFVFTVLFLAIFQAVV